jgi:hypothetical protein
MKKIKVIKKGSASVTDERVNTVVDRSPVKSSGREAVKTIESWIADCRERTESETRRAFAELSGLKFRH